MTLKYKKPKDFDNTNGGNPAGSFIQASDGKLCSMTAYGGSSGVDVNLFYLLFLNGAGLIYISPLENT